jgi:hypothetical protein
MPAFAEPARPQEELYREAMESIAGGRAEDASDKLSRMIALEPEHAGAWLDLAIIQCQLGRAAEAERLFQAIESRFDPPPGIREVIRSHRIRGCAGWQPRSQWSLSLGRGRDTNVNQGASSPNFSIGNGTSRIDLQLLPEFLPQDDDYTLLAADYLRDVRRNGVGFAQLRLRKNDSLSRYDTTSLRLGMEQLWQFGDWSMRGTAAVGLLKLGSQLYQRQGQLQARISVPVSLPEGVQFNLLTGFSRVQYATLKNYDASTAEFGGLLAYQDHRVQVQGSAGYLSDHGRATRLGGDRQGWFAGVQGSVRLPANLIGELGWTRQHWLADSAYSPGLIDAVRRQDTHLIRAGLTLPIKPHHALNIEWRKVINHENISIFQYNSQLLQVTWQWQDF